MQRLKVSENGRFLVREDSSRFFWLADTAWELLHHCTLNQAKQYLIKRSEQYFNVIQTVILAECDGLTTPTPDGFYPLKKDENGNYRPDMPDADGEENYFTHIDRVIEFANECGMYVALVPTWGDKWNLKWGTGPEIFTPENAFLFGRFLGNRYNRCDNLIWVLGGDRPIENDTHAEIVRNIAKGIKTGGATQIMTFHPDGRHSSSEYVQNEDWLDFHMIQSGHADYITKTDEMITKDYLLSPIKPVLDGECNYEDHPIGFRAENGFFDDTDVRRASYRAVFSGSCGITYGHHSVWPMIHTRDELENHSKNSDKTYFLMTMWDALDRPGANQMRYLRQLIESLAPGGYVPANEILAQCHCGAKKQLAITDGHSHLIYCPLGLRCGVKLNKNPSEARWMNPGNGTYQIAKAEKKDEILWFYPPCAGRSEDFVLILC